MADEGWQYEYGKPYWLGEDWDYEPCFPEGAYSAYADVFGMEAVVVFEDEIVKNFTGESAWSDAARDAGDRNQMEDIEQRKRDAH